MTHDSTSAADRDPHGWWSDQDFWEDMFEFMFPAENIAEGEEVAARAASLLGVPPGAALLDLGCGPGRIAVPLARRGFRVTGVDAQSTYLARAEEWAEREGLSVSFLRGDMSRLGFDQVFDGALCVFNSFGYFADPARDQQVLDCAYAAIRPGARFVLETAHRDGVVRRMYVRERTGPDGRLWREEPSFDPMTGILTARWTLGTPARVRSFVTRMRPYSAGEIAEMMRRAGFQDVRLQRDLDGGTPSVESYMLVAVGVRVPRAEVRPGSCG